MQMRTNKEILAVVNQMVSDGQITQEVVEKYFPELRESKDEIMMRIIMNALIKVPYSELDGLIPDTIRIWLEGKIKQGEQDPAWSEDVEAAISLLKHIAEEQEKDYCPYNANNLRKAAQYLETCRPQSQWKEQLMAKAVDVTIAIPYQNGYGGYTQLVDSKEGLPFGENLKVLVIEKEIDL